MPQENTELVVIDSKLYLIPKALVDQINAERDRMIVSSIIEGIKNSFPAKAYVTAVYDTTLL